jgi:ubiquitin carboxyl-terminal hydrolase 22/27/51
MVQRIFSGLLQSDVICCACGHTSTAHDPFVDISLDIGVPPPPPPPLLRPPAPNFQRCPAPACLISCNVFPV